MAEHAVEIRGLEKRFPQFTLGPLDLTVPLGSIYGLVGPNGAGKTTTLDLIFGMGTANAGSITVLGFDHLLQAVAMKRQVAYVSPDLHFEPWGRPSHLIPFVRGFYPRWDQECCERLLERFRVRPNERISDMSFGTRIKLALVLALSWKPRVLVLDEPTAGLDAVARRDLFTELLAVVQDDQRAVLISSHSLTDIERFADYLGLIKNGRLMLEGATSDVLGRFKIVDFVAESGFAGERPGIIVQERQDDRVRALLDLRVTPLEQLERIGGRVLGEAPVSLEDLFVMLERV